MRRCWHKWTANICKAERADVKDVSNRLLRHILNCADKLPILKENAIICTGDLMPSETLLMDKTKIKGFCTRSGSVNSHTAILAEKLGIPAIVNVGRSFMTITKARSRS